jgi:Fe-S cluster assembly ATP-binding protein
MPSWTRTGSGKSTLAYVLAGKTNYQVTAGEVLFEGEDLLAMQPDERAGTHCVMPLLERYGVTATCRASFALFTTRRMRSIRWPSPWSRHGSFSHE